jgi:hypothetical protein
MCNFTDCGKENCLSSQKSRMSISYRVTVSKFIVHDLAALKDKHHSSFQLYF